METLVVPQLRGPGRHTFQSPQNAPLQAILQALQARSVDPRFQHAFQQAGVLEIAVNATDESGRLFFPMGTPARRYEDGDHEILFHLVRTGDVKVRILGARPGMAVMLVDRKGGSIPVRPARKKYVRLIRAGPDGRFDLYDAPVGRYSLRIGLPAELETGSFQYEQEIEIQPGVNAPIEWRL